MNRTDLTAVGRPSLLSRVSLVPNSELTQSQAFTDQLVGATLQEATQLKAAAAMLGSGWVNRLIRVGAMASLPQATVWVQALRWASHLPALAAESAVFAGIERGIHRLEGHSPLKHGFPKDWARAAVTLTGLKLFGGISRGQNIVLQHLLTDLGLVGAQHAASVAGLAEKPQGGLARQMLAAEAANWHMKGSLSLAHSLSPRLLATERSLALLLEATLNPAPLPTPTVGPVLSLALALPGKGPAPVLKGPESEHIVMMSQDKKGDWGNRIRDIFAQAREATGLPSRESSRTIGSPESSPAAAPKWIQVADLIPRPVPDYRAPDNAQEIVEKLADRGILPFLEQGNVIAFRIPNSKLIRRPGSPSVMDPGHLVSVASLPVSFEQALRVMDASALPEIMFWHPNVEMFPPYFTGKEHIHEMKLITPGPKLHYLIQHIHSTIPGGYQRGFRLYKIGPGEKEFTPDSGYEDMETLEGSFTIGRISPRETLFIHEVHAVVRAHGILDWVIDLANLQERVLIQNAHAPAQALANYAADSNWRRPDLSATKYPAGYQHPSGRAFRSVPIRASSERK